MRIIMADKNEILNIYTDGACKGNPGIGGWGAILEYGNTKKEIKGYSINTTNNIMELTAVIKALECLNRKCKIVITTDSNYVKNGITDWIKSWKNNGWKTAKKSPVKNKELWIKLDSLVANHDIDWKWIKGHSGHPQNERADELANEAIILKGQ
jgi:ribonuclease HI